MNGKIPRACLETYYPLSLPQSRRVGGLPRRLVDTEALAKGMSDFEDFARKGLIHDGDDGRDRMSRGLSTETRHISSI